MSSRKPTSASSRTPTHDKVLDALRASLPVDRETARAVAMKALEGKVRETREFEKWFDTNGDVLVKILNEGR